LEEFVKQRDGKRFISTVRLPEYLAKWTELARCLSVEEKQLIAQRNEPILKEARLLTHILGSVPSGGNLSLHLFLPVPLDIALSCALLGEALALTNATLFDTSPSMSWSSGDLFLERLEMDGWCPFIVSGINESSRLGTLYYCATLGGPKVKLNHGRCTEKLCYHTLNIQARHFMQDCACSMLKPQVEEVASAIRRNQTPILRYWKGGHTDTLETGEASNSTAYVAISHVWSDGLGNPKGNQMNVCQLKRVQIAVDRLYQQPDDHKDSRWWWLDTLCVPKGDAYKKEEGFTISRMKEIYTKADKVLIIDSGLSACNELTDVLEILARFRLSNWFRRLWTIQEGLFARAIYLLVGATPVSLSSLISEAKRLPREGFQNKIGQDLIANYESIFGSSMSTDIGSTAIARFDPVPTERRLLGVLRTVASRTSTFLRGEPLCLALLLDINPTLIIHEIDKERREKERRGVKNEEDEAHKGGNGDKVLPPDSGSSTAGMIKFIELANEASQSLKPPGCISPHIIATLGKRLNKPGFQWAPVVTLARPP
jgi:hypothetical protein